MRFSIMFYRDILLLTQFKSSVKSGQVTYPGKSKELDTSG